MASGSWPVAWLPSEAVGSEAGVVTLVILLSVLLLVMMERWDGGMRSLKSAAVEDVAVVRAVKRACAWPHWWCVLAEETAVSRAGP